MKISPSSLTHKLCSRISIGQIEDFLILRLKVRVLPATFERPRNDMKYTWELNRDIYMCGTSECGAGVFEDGPLSHPHIKRWTGNVVHPNSLHVIGLNYWLTKEEAFKDAEELLAGLDNQ